MYLRAFAIPRLQHAQVKERSRKRDLFPKTYNTFLCPPHLFPDSHSFSTAALHLPIPLSASLPHNSYGPLHHGQPWRFRVHAQAAGGHRSRGRRLRQAEEGWGAEFFGAVSVSWRHDAVVLGACHAAVLSLLLLRRVGRCVQLRAENREHYFPGGGEGGRVKAEDPSPESQL